MFRASRVPARRTCRTDPNRFRRPGNGQPSWQCSRRGIGWAECRIGERDRRHRAQKGTHARRTRHGRLAPRIEMGRPAAQPIGLDRSERCHSDDAHGRGGTQRSRSISSSDRHSPGGHVGGRHIPLIDGHPSMLPGEVRCGAAMKVPSPDRFCTGGGGPSGGSGAGRQVPGDGPRARSIPPAALPGLIGRGWPPQRVYAPSGSSTSRMRRSSSSVGGMVAARSGATRTSHAIEACTASSVAPGCSESRRICPSPSKW